MNVGKFGGIFISHGSFFYHVLAFPAQTWFFDQIDSFQVISKPFFQILKTSWLSSKENNYTEGGKMAKVIITSSCHNGMWWYSSIYLMKYNAQMYSCFRLLVNTFDGWKYIHNFLLSEWGKSKEWNTRSIVYRLLSFKHVLASRVTDILLLFIL